MTFALLGFLSPANRYVFFFFKMMIPPIICLILFRGGLMTAFLLLFVFMGSFAGYHSARMYDLHS